MNATARRAVVFFSPILALLLGSASSAQAQFEFVSQSAIYNPVTQEVYFTVEFSQPPDFFTVDEFGRQAHSFQYFIVGDRTLPYPERYDAIVRAEEIHLSGDVIRIRRARPSVPDPEAGGWGELVGEVPFAVDGTTLTFAAPLAMLSEHSTDGRFDYELMSVEFGAMTKFVTRRSKVRIIVAPDYVVTQVTNPPQAARNGEPFSITATVQNAGNLAAAASSTTRYFLSLDPVFGGSDRGLPARTTVPPLAIGASDTQSVTLGVPTTLPSGTYHVLACADRTVGFPELDKRNNCTASAGTVAVTAP
jgi:hypothetical protein